MDLATGNDGKTMKIRPFETNNQINMQGAAVLQNDHVDSFFCSLPLKNAEQPLEKSVLSHSWDKHLHRSSQERPGRVRGTAATRGP